MPRQSRVASVFLNIPYDRDFENLYLAYVVGLTQLGLRINAALAVPNQGRLTTIIDLIEKSDFSIHDLSRVEFSDGVPDPKDLAKATRCDHRCRNARRPLSSSFQAAGTEEEFGWPVV